MTKTFRTKRKRSIGTLPDGNHAYLDSLRKFVTWIEEQANPSRLKFLEWLQEERLIKENSAANYWQVLVRLGFLLESNATVSLTDFAKQFLAGDDLQQAEMIFEKLYREFEGIPELVNLYLELPNTPKHLSDILEKLKLKEILSSPTSLENRIHWLASLGIIEESIPRVYRISEFGRKLANKYIYIKVSSAKTEKAYGDYLIQELTTAVRYSKEYDRLENILVEIAAFVGYRAERISKAGNTDVVVEARLLNKGYSGIWDGKSRKKGKVTDVNLDRILTHKLKHKADYAIVIAEDFSDGGLIRSAEARGVTLMTTYVLCKWIELHASTPLNLIDYRDFFSSPGLLKEIPPTIQKKLIEIKKQQTVIRDIVRMIQEQTQDNLYIEQAPDVLRTAISVSSRELLDKNLISTAIQLLCHPAINAAQKDENDGMFLAMGLSTIKLLLLGLADRLEGD